MNYFLYASMAKLRFTLGLRSLGLAWLGIRVACKPNAETRVMADRSNFWKMANTAGKKKGRSMNPLIQLNRRPQHLFIALLFACFAIAQSAIAVTPEPDGGYPDGNTAEEDSALLDLNTGTDTPTASFPLKKSANNRYLTRQDGTPFLLIGDSNWMAVAQFTNANIDTYLADRAAKGFNTIVVQTIDSFFADNAPNNIDGVAPFTVPNNFSTANPAYYTRFDYLLDRAATYGMVVVTFPLYMGYQCGEVGWAQQMRASSTANLQTFGTFLGNRYKNKPNIIWAMAGDVDPPTCGLSAKLNAFATALATADPNHLITEHNNGGEAVTPWLASGVPSWLTLNSTYGPSPLTFTQGRTAWNRTPTRPFFHLESYYENDTRLTTGRKGLRNEAYWSMLTNICGYMFGNCPLWGAGSAVTHTKCPSVSADWRLQLNSPGARDMTRLKNLFTSVAWQTLVPDFTHTTVTAGYGSGTTTVTTARASNGSFVLSYLPALNRVTVNMTRLGPSVVARWYDPSNGAYTTIPGSPFPNIGTRTFTPTTNNSSGASDWVLVLQSG